MSVCSASAGLAMDTSVSVVDTLKYMVIVWTSTMVMANRRERIIKGLLNDSVYDNRIPPNYEDNFPTNVTIQIYILSFDSVKEASMVTYDGSQSRNLPYTATGSSTSGYQSPRFDYSVTIFLRELWEDKRLQWGDDFSRLFTQCNSSSNNSSSSSNSSSRNTSGVNNENVDKNVTKCNVVAATQKEKEDEIKFGNNGDETNEGKEEILERLEVDSKLLDMVWMPDLYFLNDKEATIHDVTMANRLLHIYRNGTIRTSSRISMTLSCDMYLDRYPHDQQTCSMLLGSYSYSAENVLFQWHDPPVVIREGVTLPRFEVELSNTGPCNFHFGEGSMINGNYTCISADFKLTREFGYYIAQVYVPSCLIVALSWVSFWIDLDAIPARVSLGLLTVLTMTTQSTGEKASLPRVSYLKAIDVWMAGCLIFVFGALLEFAYVNVQSRVEKRRRETVHPHQPRAQPSDSGGKLGDPGGVQNGTNHTPCDTEFKPVEDSEVEVTVTTQHSKTRTQSLFQRYQAAKEKARTADKCSRVIFPFAFLVFNIVYWMIFVAAPL